MTLITKTRATNITRAVLARRTGTNLSTIRYYEEIGLITLPQRAANGYRIYDSGHVTRSNPFPSKAGRRSKGEPLRCQGFGDFSPQGY